MRYRPIPQPHDLTIDLAVPYGKPLPAEQTHTVQPPPSDDRLAVEVAGVLAANESVAATVAALSVFLPDISVPVLQQVLGLANRGTKALPNHKPSAVGLPKSTTPMAEVRHGEVYYRAAYLINAARRIQSEVSAGEPVRTALADESLHYRQHEKARAGRMQAAANVARDASRYGDLLGWYLNPLLNNEIECIRADGHNFSAAAGTVIGLPGSVHANCGCKSGPPIEGAGMVNDAVAPILRYPSGKKYRLKIAG